MGVGIIEFPLSAADSPQGGRRESPGQVYIWSPERRGTGCMMLLTAIIIERIIMILGNIH